MTVLVLGTIVTSWAAGVSCRGLTFDGRHLYFLDSTNDQIRKYTKAGVLINSWATPSDNGTGLAFDGRNIWYGDPTTDLLYCLKIDGFGLRVVGSWPAVNCYGLTFNGKQLIMGRTGALLLDIYNVPPGPVIQQITYPVGWQIWDMAFDGKHVWECDRAGNLVRCLATFPTAEMVGSFAFLTLPNGLTFDGKYLWVSTTTGTVSCIEVN